LGTTGAPWHTQSAPVSPTAEVLVSVAALQHASNQLWGHHSRMRPAACLLYFAAATAAAATAAVAAADKGTANQAQRVHITLELAWSADATVQQLGRTHRSNQVSCPIYKIVSSNICGEHR
jgi:hypothetical protein